MPPPAPIPNPVAGDSTGLSDTQWITDARDALRDYPEYFLDSWTADGTNGVISWNAAPLKTTHKPIYDGSLLVRDTTSGTSYSVITSGTPSGTQVLVNYDTGEITWASAPTNGHVINLSYQTIKWRDYSISDALYAGLRAMFPRVGKVYVDTSVSIQVNVWDYQLPVWFQDPRSILLKVEIADPYIPTEPFVPMLNCERVGLDLLHIPIAGKYSPVARLRITGWGPYLTLGDLEPQLYQLPIWYALSVLLPKQESKRIREDTMVPLTQEGGQQPGLLTQTGDYYAKRFEQELQRLSRMPGPVAMMPIRTVYQRARHY